MKINQIVFSPTGGTMKAAGIITNKLGMDVFKVDLTNTKNDYSAINIDQEDIAVIAVPSYGGRVPAAAAERLGKIKGNQARCIVVCVYGNRAYEDTLLELKDIAEQSNFRVISAVAAIAEHSIVNQYAHGRPDSRDKEELQGFADKILEKIKKGTADTSSLNIPGNRPYKNLGKGGLVPQADSSCCCCGICAKWCPVQAISKENIKTADSEKCIHCMRCVLICISSARKVNEGAVSAIAQALKKVCSERKNNELFI